MLFVTSIEKYYTNSLMTTSPKSYKTTEKITKLRNVRCHKIYENEHFTIVVPAFREARSGVGCRYSDDQCSRRLCWLTGSFRSDIATRLNVTMQKIQPRKIEDIKI